MDSDSIFLKIIQSGVCCPDPADFCYEPRDPGTGNEFETRYGYDPTTNECIGYQYGTFEFD